MAYNMSFVVSWASELVRTSYLCTKKQECTSQNELQTVLSQIQYCMQNKLSQLLTRTNDDKLYLTSCQRPCTQLIMKRQQAIQMPGIWNWPCDPSSSRCFNSDAIPSHWNLGEWEDSALSSAALLRFRQPEFSKMSLIEKEVSVLFAACSIAIHVLHIRQSKIHAHV